MLQNPVRVGIVGCGFIASEVHAPALARVENVRVTALADRDEGRLSRYAERAGMSAESCFSEVEDLLRFADVDAILISTPPASHGLIAERALEAGKHVLVEKPMALSATDCSRMIDSASRASRQLSVVSNFQHFPEIAELRRGIASGRIGEPLLLRISAWGLGMDVVNFLRFAGGESDWKYRLAAAGGGVLMDYGVHCAYLAELILGAPAASLYCSASRRSEHHGDVEDQAVLIARHGEADAILDLSWLPEETTASRNLQHGALEILGTAGRVLVEYVPPVEGPHSVARAVHWHCGSQHDVELLPDTTRRDRLIQSFTDTFAAFADRCASESTDLSEARRARRAVLYVQSAYESASRAAVVQLESDFTGEPR